MRLLCLIITLPNFTPLQEKKSHSAKSKGRLGVRGNSFSELLSSFASKCMHSHSNSAVRFISMSETNVLSNHWVRIFLLAVLAFLFRVKLPGDNKIHEMIYRRLSGNLTHPLAATRSLGHQPSSPFA